VSDVRKVESSPNAPSSDDEAHTSQQLAESEEAKALRDTSALRAVAESSRPDSDGVAALLKIAEDTVEDERERGRALDTKTGSLVGFSDLILSLNGAVAKPLFDADLGVYETPIKILFGISITSLLIAVVIAILGVIRPQRYRGFGRAELRSFATAEAQSMTRLVVHQRMLGAVANMLDTNRRLNNSKARLTEAVGWFLAVGFIAVAAQAGVVGISQIGVETSACTRRTVEISTGTETTRTTTTTCS